MEGVIFSEEEALFNERAIGCIKENLPIPGGGVLFYGEPGNGKTLTVKHIAEKSGAALMTIKPSDICKPNSGQVNATGATALKAIFEIAFLYKNALGQPVIIFIDEVDFAGQKRMTAPGLDMKCIIAEMLQQVQEASKQKGIYLMAATNYNDYLDKALKRDGRFGQHVFLKNPDYKTITKMIATISKAEPTSEIVHIAAEKAVGLAKSSIVDSMQEAATDCLLKGLITRSQETHYSLSSFWTKCKNYFRKADKKDTENLIATAVKQNENAFWQHVLQSFDRKAVALKLALAEEKLHLNPQHISAQFSECVQGLCDTSDRTPGREGAAAAAA